MSETGPEIDTEALLRKPIWTVEELAAFLSLPVKTIYVQRAKGDLCAGYRFGKHVRFKREDVLAWLRPSVTRLDRRAINVQLRTRINGHYRGLTSKIVQASCLVTGRLPLLT